MKQVTINTYQYDELSDEAKETAREWYAQCIDIDGWSEHIVKDDAPEVGLKITAFDTDHYCKGGFIGSPQETADLILENHGESCDTFKTAESFLRDIAPYQLVIDEYQEGDEDAREDAEEKIEEAEQEFLQSLLEDYRIMPRQEYEYQFSEESIAENIRINEYEFTEDGKRFVVKREAVNV
jgi:MarR-like DNA-binding transcriptional regulator SgrR of sgrS sRNA